jgi:hypothetical protein
LSPVQEEEEDPAASGRDDETYIIEPAGDGDIYVYSRSSGGLEKLPLSMAELVNLSPFRFPGDNSRMFSASKHTKFVGVDIKTGRLVGVFGSNAGWCEWDEGDELSGGARKERIDEDCEEDIEKRPEDLLYMARTGECLSTSPFAERRMLRMLVYSRVSPLDLFFTIIFASSNPVLHDLLFFDFSFASFDCVFRLSDASYLDQYSRFVVPSTDARRITRLFPCWSFWSSLEHRFRSTSRRSLRHCDTHLCLFGNGR